MPREYQEIEYWEPPAGRRREEAMEPPMQMLDKKERKQRSPPSPSLSPDLEDHDKSSSTPIARQDDVCDNPASFSSAMGSSRKRRCTKTNA
ncbi:hypothetical protein KIL84_017294 [Mauremys mutica]|uniref:Uncharacterized protein n=1 Tax=Mauremys mutica TaxID=74926 RepID=A0A9D3X679_9SAUR|nr:hypothetical protein KIL84_017294 [Mauremys mutica]